MPCPTHASRAQMSRALRGGLLIIAKPTPATAAKKTVGYGGLEYVGAYYFGKRRRVDAEHDDRGRQAYCYAYYQQAGVGEACYAVEGVAVDDVHHSVDQRNAWHQIEHRRSEGYVFRAAVEINEVCNAYHRGHEGAYNEHCQMVHAAPGEPPGG